MLVGPCQANFKKIHEPLGNKWGRFRSPGEHFWALCKIGGPP